LTLADLLNFEPIRSPIGANIPIVNGRAHEIRCQDLIDLNSEKGSISTRPNKPRKKVNKKPIIAPSHVFFWG
jgi:hypothetical protein